MEPKKKSRRCCGIDVHKKSVTVCILPPEGKREGEVRKRNFRTFTRDLKQLRLWLKNCKVTEIAMESTGQYWRPLWNLLEGEFEKLLLVNPQHIKGLAGRKTDSKDARWIAELLETGKLKGSWVPPREIRELRDLTRQRVHLMEDLNRVKNRIGQLCETGNIKVSSVTKKLLGVSGRSMLQAMVAGTHDIGWMADRAKGRLRNKKPELRLALEGSLTPKQRWLLGKQLEHLEWLERQVQDLEAEIERQMAPFAEPLRRVMSVPGIDSKTAWMIVAEIGVEMSVFGDAKQLASWAGLCPGHRESGGRRMSGRTRKANPYVRRGMCQAAWAASHSKDTYLRAFYRRLLVRKGPQKSVMALAHHMITIVYNVLARGEKYVEFGANYYDERNKPKAVSRLVARLTKLGYAVDLKAIDTAPSNLNEPAPKADAGLEAPAATPPPPSLSAEGPAPFKRKPGRPCKCSQRGIPCKHGRVQNTGRAQNTNSLTAQGLACG